MRLKISNPRILAVGVAAVAIVAGSTAAAVAAMSDREQAVPRPAVAGRTPLTPGQHVLHLLLTVLTGGLWAPVWFIRAWRGNRAAL